MKGHIFLALAIIGEIIGTNLLKASDGFQKISLGFLAIFLYSLCFYFLSLAMKYLPLNLVYALWAGLGILITSLISYFFWKESFNFYSSLGIVFIIIGVLLLNLFSNK